MGKQKNKKTRHRQNHYKNHTLYIFIILLCCLFVVFVLFLLFHTIYALLYLIINPTVLEFLYVFHLVAEKNIFFLSLKKTLKKKNKKKIEGVFTYTQF